MYKRQVYNNTLLPTVFKSLKEDYYHLIENVQLWDVCAQKVIEVKGNKSLSLMQYLFCRDFNNISSGKAYYAPIVNFEGGLLNDPVVFCISDNHFLISLSDSDLFNWGINKCLMVFLLVHPIGLKAHHLLLEMKWQVLKHILFIIIHYYPQYLNH